MSEVNRYCQGPGCERETKDGRPFCWTHYRQKQRGRRLTRIIPQLSPEDQLIEAAVAYRDTGTDAGSDASHEANWRALWSAAQRCCERCAAQRKAERNGVDTT